MNEPMMFALAWWCALDRQSMLDNLRMVETGWGEICGWFIPRDTTTFAVYDAMRMARAK